MKKQESSFPQFPAEIIKGFAKDFVDLYRGKREVPDELLWAAFATYFGNLISPYVRLAGSESSEPRLYTAIIGMSGRTKKSTAQNLARDFMQGLSDSESRLRIIEGFGSAEGLISQLQLLQNNQPAIVHLDEINVLAHKTGMDGSVGITVFNKLFEDHSYEQPIRDKNPKITGARLSVVGASTLEDYQKAWSGKHKDTGFLSRILVIPAEPSNLRIAVPVAPNPDAVQRLKEAVEGCYLELQRKPKHFEMLPDALSCWEDFYGRFEDGEEWNRIDCYAFRFMALQAALTSQDAITPEIMQDAISLSLHQVKSRLHVSPVIAENQFAMVEQLIRKHLPSGTISRRDLQRKMNADRYGVQVFNRAIANLVETGELQTEQNGKRIFLTRIVEPDESSVSSVINFYDDSLTA